MGPNGKGERITRFGSSQFISLATSIHFPHFYVNDKITLRSNFSFIYNLSQLFDKNVIFF